MYDRWGTLGPLPDVRVLDLHEGADLRSLAQDGARAQVGEGTDAGVRAHLGLHQIGVDDARTVGDARVRDRGVRTDLRPRPDTRPAHQAHARADDGVLADRDAGLDTGGLGLQEGDPLASVALQDPHLSHHLGLHQVRAVVDADGAAGVAVSGAWPRARPGRA